MFTQRQLGSDRPGGQGTFTEVRHGFRNLLCPCSCASLCNRSYTLKLFMVACPATMTSWASIANKSPQVPAEPSGIAAAAQERSCAVIDTNAIIDGSQLQLYGEQLATIPEVLAEVKDKKTRDFLERFPFKLQSIEPAPESLRAGASLLKSRVCDDLWRKLPVDVCCERSDTRQTPAEGSPICLLA